MGGRRRLVEGGKLIKLQFVAVAYDAAEMVFHTSASSDGLYGTYIQVASPSAARRGIHEHELGGEGTTSNVFTSRRFLPDPRERPPVFRHEA